MKLSTFKQILSRESALNFVQHNGTPIPEHFHITEAGLLTKHFVDCGGSVRKEKAINFQLWVAEDTDHRLEPDKVLNIIATYEKLFGDQDLDIEIEYQTDTISKYGLEFEGENFVLTSKQTDCLASDHCGIPQDKIPLQTVGTEKSKACCTPGGGCC